MQIVVDDSDTPGRNEPTRIAALCLSSKITGNMGFFEAICALTSSITNGLDQAQTAVSIVQILFTKKNC
jgi:hypothetical protein